MKEQCAFQRSRTARRGIREKVGAWEATTSAAHSPHVIRDPAACYPGGMSHAFTTIDVQRTAAGLRALVAPISLRVLEGPSSGATYSAKRERITIGTHESADL